MDRYDQIDIEIQWQRLIAIMDEIDNAITKKTKAVFEPALDYCVVKIPRWPFDKFIYGDRNLGTQMKATGEVMAIDRTFESIAGAKNAIILFYNSTSTLQRKVVFGLDREGIKEIAVDAARYCKSLESTVPDTNIRYEYSPESFTGTELDFAKEICDPQPTSAAAT